MENPELNFVDEKECKQVCSTIIMSFCEQQGNKILAPRLNIGKSVIQLKATGNGMEHRKETEEDYSLRLCSISECLEYLKILTPAELVINSRDLIISSRKPGEMSKEPFSVNKLVLEEKDKMFPGGIIFVQNAELDIENLSFDFDKVEVKILEYLQISEKFNIQSKILGKQIKLLMPSNEPIDLGIQPFLSVYLPHILAKELKQEFIKKETVKLDIIGMICTTVKYMPFLLLKKKEEKGNEKKFDRLKIEGKSELRSEIIAKIGTYRLRKYTEVDVEDEDSKLSTLREFFKKSSKQLKLDKYSGTSGENASSSSESDPRSLKTDPKSLIGAIGKPKLNYGIQPTAVWVHRD